MLSNYFKSTEYLLTHLSENDKLNRQIYQQARATVMVGIEQVAEKQKDLEAVIDKYQATLLNSPKKDDKI